MSQNRGQCIVDLQYKAVLRCRGFHSQMSNIGSNMSFAVPPFSPLKEPKDVCTVDGRVLGGDEAVELLACTGSLLFIWALYTLDTWLGFFITV
jgi:predicted fused transcriptional regulator/phosphomethylpyrimidine kinase